MMISTLKASEMSGYTRSRVISLAREGSIEGAAQLPNGVWQIPIRWAEEMSALKEEMKNTVSIIEAARLAKVSRAAIYKALAQGRLKGVTFERKGKGNRQGWSVSLDSLQDYIEEREGRMV